MESHKEHIAICLRGTVSRIRSMYHLGSELYTDLPYVDWRIAHEGIVNNILKPNNKYVFDFFIHSWAYELEDATVKLYRPKAYLFEDNNRYREDIRSHGGTNPEDFVGLSQSLSMKKSIELMQNYEINNDIQYKFVILFRPDTLLWNPMFLDHYDSHNVYVCGDTHEDSKWTGDSHFVMNHDDAIMFKEMYSLAGKEIQHKTHYWQREYVHAYMKKELTKDNVLVARDYSAIRELGHDIDRRGSPANKILSYGIPIEELRSYSYILNK